MTHKYQPINDLERFELMHALFPEELTDEDHDLGDEEDLIYEKFGVEPEQFDLIVGHLVTLAPVMTTSFTHQRMHVLGRVTVEGDTQTVHAVVKRLKT